MSVGYATARPLSPWRWLVAPMLISMLASLAFAAPIRVIGLPLPEPIFAMAPTFAWALLRPSILAPFCVLAMGLFLDLLWGGPLGLWPLSLLVSYAGVLSARSLVAGQGRLVLWAWYAGACALVMLAAFLFTMLDAKATPDYLSVFWQWLATAVLFPLSNRLIDRFEDADVRFR